MDDLLLLHTLLTHLNSLVEDKARKHPQYVLLIDHHYTRSLEFERLAATINSKFSVFPRQCL